jgi:hypothetical protein
MVKETFIAYDGNGAEEYHKGEIADADHPAVRKYPMYFEPMVARHQAKPEVEQATAAPGEKRGH